MINRKVCEVMKKDVELIEKLKEKNEIYKITIKGQHRRIEELKQAKKVSKQIQKERNKRLRKENELLKERIEEAIDYIENNSGMISKWTRIKSTYAQEELSTDQLDNLLEILKGEKE